MAESILYELAGNILTKLGSIAFRELWLLWGVNEELDKLKQTLSSIQAVLLDAEEKQSKSHAVKDWVSKLEDVLYEIDDLMDESSYETLRRQVMAKDRRKTKQVCMFFAKFKFHLKMGHKIKEVRQRLKAISDDKTQFSFSEHYVIDTRHDDQRKKKRETYSFILEDEVIGRKNDKEEIIKRLLSNTNTKEDIEMISIVGMGGLGKTALAQSVYNNNMITEHFELKLWVCVSEEFDVKILMEKIIESATKTKPESFLQMDSLQIELRRHMDGKKYLLVMDDVWNEDHEKWVTLKRLLMGGAKGSRILITTRDERVAKTFDTTFLYSLQNLDECNSWLLFKKMTFLEEQEEELENSNLVEIGKEIVAKLNGIPLAIRTIGRLLYENKSKRNYWLSFRDKELHQVMGEEKNDLEYMQSILELSYKHLPANLKQCFRYCALFPKDYEIPKDDLILQWRAQGYIPQNDRDDQLIDIGEDYFLELLSKSFFQEVTKDELGNIKASKMHDLMHDLACSITKNEYIHELIKDIDKRTHHFSLRWMLSLEVIELQQTLSKARNLRSFFVLQSVDCWELDCDKLFHDHFRLRTLIVWLLCVDHKIKNFESTIGRFKQLRYLNFSHVNFKDLPNCMTKLYNLETLILRRWTNLQKLPSDIKNWINLKHLDLSMSEALEFLPDSITELCKLEVFFLDNCSKLKGLPRDVKNWINLRHLHLSNNRSIKYLPDSITQLNNLETLLLPLCSNLKELPEDTKKLINLKHLDMTDCWALTHMPKGLGELTSLQILNEFALGENNSGEELSELNGLNKLKGCLHIRNLEFCTWIDKKMNAKLLQLKSGLGQLRLEWKDSYNEPTIGNLDDVYEIVLDCLQPHSNLQELYIKGYRGMKLCNWLSSDSLGGLVTISLVGCKRLQHLPQFDQFPNLKNLSLDNLPSIEYIGNNDSVSSSTSFPALETLRIVKMPKLKRWWKLGTTNSTEFTSTSVSIIFPCLSYLEISGSLLHILISWHAQALKSLKIGEEDYCIEEAQFDVVPWENFENLSYICLCKLSKLEYLPKCLQHVTTLQHLALSDCENLKSLPEWIDNLTSLTKLAIYNCKKLTLLPKGIRHIHALQLLSIVGCPILQERCKKDTGEDWPKIAHIPEKYIP